MREFPKKLKPVNRKLFRDYFYERNLCYMRRQIYELLLSRNYKKLDDLDEVKATENEFFDLTTFNDEKVKNKELAIKMATQIENELMGLGWKCKWSFANTGLFIYSTEVPPPSCWEEEIFE